MAKTIRLQKQRKVADKARQEQLGKNLFENTALAQQLVKVIEMAVYMGMKDLPRLIATKTKTAVNVRTIESACNNIRLNLNEVVKVDPNFADIMENDHAYELYRLCRNMFFYPTEHLEEFNNGIELQHKEYDRNKG